MRLDLFCAAWFCLAGLCAQAAHTEVRLVLAQEQARPGDTVLAGLHLRMDAGWHIYWRNPGNSGIPTQAEWSLPKGVTAGPIQWPAPEKLQEQDLTTFIYKNEVVLLVPLHLAADLASGPVELKAKVSWLECAVSCIPGGAPVAATLKVGEQSVPSKDAGLIETWQKKLPKPGAALSSKAWWEKAATGNLRPFVLEWNSPNAAAEADFFPDASEDFEIEPAADQMPAAAGTVRLRYRVKKTAGDWPRQISGLLVQKSGPDGASYEIHVSIGSLATEAGGTRSVESTASPVTAAPALWTMLLYALLGGLVLNVMPCVLPVLALKILGFIGQAKEDPRRVRVLGLFYGLGVLASFLILAGLVIGAKALGHKIGWGMQFGNPLFLVCLITLVTLVALNLFGVFEVTAGGQLLRGAGALSGKHGATGAFFNGVLATTLATPCTAPFLGAALGFAFSQSAAIVVLMFLTVGLGLAAPYVALSWQPRWLRFLPKPGPWMERVKVAAGFPMLATAVWLSSLIPAYYAGRSWWLGIFLVTTAGAAWTYGQFVQRALSRRWLGIAATGSIFLIGYSCILEGELRWRDPVPAGRIAGPPNNNPEGIDWQPWSRAAVIEARAAGRPVIVDFTADWCLTCQVNKRLAIDVTAVRAKLKELHAAALLGDYTRFPDEITEELNRFGRAGVPLVLVYPRNPSQPPIVLPEALTPGIVRDALDRAAR
jgi:thiol:disulfide interchange protein